MPFGLTNAPLTFQRAMNTILEGCPYIRGFLDDILIFSKSYKEHVTHIKTVLKKLQGAGAKINFDKSKFCKEEVEYLGMIINRKGVKVNVNRVDAHLGSKKIKTKMQLQESIRFINWFREFVSNLSTKVAKLTNKLSRENKKVYWSKKDNIIKDKVLNKIKKQILLAYADLNGEFTLTTNASNIGIEGILMKKNKVIALFSRKLSGAELNYSVVEKELYAVVKSLENFGS